jgi:hypothetical protein
MLKDMTRKGVVVISSRVAAQPARSVSSRAENDARRARRKECGMENDFEWWTAWLKLVKESK